MRNNYFNVFIISSTGIIGGLINYFYHPLMLHYLSIQQFGVFGSLVGIFNILGILVAGISLFLLKEVSQYKTDLSKVKQIFLGSTRVLGWVGLGLFACYLLVSPLIAQFLHIESGLVALIGGVIVFSFLGIGATSMLTGLKKFEFLGLTQILTPTIKLLVGFGLVSLGFSLYGAVRGCVISAFVGFAISFLYGANYLKATPREGTQQDLLSDFMKNKTSIIHFFLVSLFFAFLMNCDVIFARNIFDAQQAGIYAGISIIGKFLIFALLSVETVYYGQIMQYTKQTLPSRLIKNPLLLILLGGLVAVGINYFIGGWVLGTLKAELSSYTAPYLLMLVYYVLLALVGFIAKILIGRGKYTANYFLLATCILVAGAVYIFGKGNLSVFVLSLLIALIVGGVAIGGLFMKILFSFPPGGKSL